MGSGPVTPGSVPGEGARSIHDQATRNTEMPPHLDGVDTSTTVHDLGIAGAVRNAAPTENAGTTVTTPLEALRLDEIRRSRLLGITGTILVAAVFIALPFLELEPKTLPILVVAMIVTGILNVWLIYLCAKPERYTPTRVGVIWITVALMISGGILYFGVFSPAPIILVLGIYFISLGASFPIAFGVYFASAATQLALGLAVALDFIDDPGLVHVDYRDTQTRVVGVLLIQIVYAATFILSRSSRRTLMQSVTEFDHAVRSVAQREALFQEAKQDLERALRAGNEGRYSGQTVGSFKLGPVIGRGAMGEVYEASHVASNELAAVKLMHPKMLEDQKQVKRFLREAEAASRLQVDNVVRVLEVGGESDTIPYLAMERLHGLDLAQVLRNRRRLEADLVTDLVRQVGSAINAAAEAGIVHRDLKPQNLFFAAARVGDEPSVWKVLDFGVSKLAETSGTLTHGHIVGTPSYMPPEQAVNQPIDHRADLYALAAIAYRALTGHLPFSGDGLANIIYKLVYTMPVKPTTLAPEYPEEIDAFFAIAIAKSPDDRFASATEMSRALESALAGRLAPEYRERAAQLSREHAWA